MKYFKYIEETVILELDKKQCTGCSQCTIVCPHRVLTMENRKAHIADKGRCMECGACAKNCPVDAITVNPDPGCGCATLIIAGWLDKLLSRKTSSGCC